jgi:molybdopterin-guanine dinucleotide biosynthesis protein A
MLVGSVILAGGRSRRMGQPKEALAFGKSTLLGTIVDVLIDCTFPVVIVARDDAQALPPLPIEVEICYDATPGAGPLLALRDGMRALAARVDAVFVTGCDFPFLTTRAVGWLVDQLGDHDMVLTQTANMPQPLLGVYRVSLLPLIEALIAEGVRTPRTIAERCRARVLDEATVRGFDSTLRLLRNINSQDEYRAALKE